MTMIAIEPITPQESKMLKDVRLLALKDTPSAFGSTYERESHFTDEEWAKRATGPSDGSRITFLARDGEEVCGIVGGGSIGRMRTV
jgi:hypothetical protein